MSARVAGFSVGLGAGLLAACQSLPRHEVAPEGWTPATADIVDAMSGHDGNGISVGAVKIYDSASLRAKLDRTRAQLDALSGFNQDALTSHVGNLSGASISQQQIGIGISSAVPSVTTNAAAASGSVITDPTGATTTANSPTLSTSSVSPATPAAPAVPATLAFTPPSTFTPSSLDILSEQMQLSNELANYELLLEGSLSDLYITNQRYPKQRSTIGFHVEVHPRAEFKNAVAVVEVATFTRQNDMSDEPPSITALLPREKTYNVASIKDRTTSLGGGVVLGAVSLGGSFLSGHKTIYVVKDQDTVAVQMPPLSLNLERNAARFAWEFHPVLGEPFVRSTPRETFAQLAFPVLPNPDCLGWLTVRTYWREFDQDTGLVGNIIPGSVYTTAKAASIPSYDLSQIVAHASATDVGGGNLLVEVSGNFLNGTYVQLGPNRYDNAQTLVTQDTGLKFVAPAAAFAQWTAHVIARNGISTPVLNGAPVDELHQTACVPDNTPTRLYSPTYDKKKEEEKKKETENKKVKQQCDGERDLTIIDGPNITPFDESRSVLQLTIHPKECSVLDLPDNLLMMTGGKVFGLLDAPILRQPVKKHDLVMTALVPTESVVAPTASVAVFLPLWSDPEAATKKADVLPPGANPYFARVQAVQHHFSTQAPSWDSEVERLVLVSVDKGGTGTFVLYGNDLEHAAVLLPKSGATLSPVHRAQGQETRILTMTKAALTGTKKLVLSKQGASRPLVIDLPALPADKSADKDKSKVSADSPVVQNTQELDVALDDAKNLATIDVDGKTVHWNPVGPSKIRLVTLKDDGFTTDQRTLQLTFTYKDKTADKPKLTLDVVAARVFVKQAAPDKKSGG